MQCFHHPELLFQSTKANNQILYILRINYFRNSCVTFIPIIVLARATNKISDSAQNFLNFSDSVAKFPSILTSKLQNYGCYNCTDQSVGIVSGSLQFVLLISRQFEATRAVSGRRIRARLTPFPQSNLLARAERRERRLSNFQAVWPSPLSAIRSTYPSGEKLEGRTWRYPVSPDTAVFTKHGANLRV